MNRDETHAVQALRGAKARATERQNIAMNLRDDVLAREHTLAGWPRKGVVPPCSKQAGEGAGRVPAPRLPYFIKMNRASTAGQFTTFHNAPR